MIEKIDFELREKTSKAKIQEIHELITQYNEIDTIEKYEDIQSEIIESIVQNEIDILKLLISEEVKFQN